MAEESKACLAQEREVVVEESWKPVVGYEGEYEVSNLARIRTLKWKKTPHVVSQGVSKRGYFVVDLSHNDKKKVWNVHRLVALAFLGPCPPGKEVCHNDGNRLNSNLNNLRYGSRADNVHDSMRHGTFRPGGNHSSLTPSNVTLTPSDVKEIFTSPETCAALARRFGIHHTHPGKIKSRKLWKSVTESLVPS